jgi:hypothetical protein
VGSRLENRCSVPTNIFGYTPTDDTRAQKSCVQSNKTYLDSCSTHTRCQQVSIPTRQQKGLLYSNIWHHELLWKGKEVSEESAFYYTLKWEWAGYSKTVVRLFIHQNISHYIPVIFNIMLANFLFTERYRTTCNDFWREIPVVIRTHELSYPHPQRHVCLRLSSLSYILEWKISNYHNRIPLYIQ